MQSEYTAEEVLEMIRADSDVESAELARDNKKNRFIVKTTRLPAILRLRISQGDARIDSVRSRSPVEFEIVDQTDQ